ncbi:MAG: hypothetical protein WCT04_13050 [Planctomycetota bacterium]
MDTPIPLQPDTAKPTGKRQFLAVFGAVLGSIIMGAIMPSLLVILRLQGSPLLKRETIYFLPLFVVVSATIGCTPGAVVLSLLLFFRLEKHSAQLTLRKLVIKGVQDGAIMAFFNLPGYLALVFFWEENFAVARLVLLFIVAGSSCGMWVAWHVWSAWRPGERYWPRFSLGTLMIVVLLWGAAMLAFQPERRPKQPVNSRIEALDD